MDDDTRLLHEQAREWLAQLQGQSERADVIRALSGQSLAAAVVRSVLGTLAAHQRGYREHFSPVQADSDGTVVESMTSPNEPDDPEIDYDGVYDYQWIQSVLDYLRDNLPETASLLAACLDDTDEDVRMQAIIELIASRTDDPQAIAALYARLHLPTREGLEAARALIFLGVANGIVRDALLTRIQRGEKTERSNAIRVLRELDPDSVDRACSDTLLACLDDEDSAIRNDAVWAIGQLGLSDPYTIDRLARHLQDRDDGVSTCAARVIAKLGVTTPRLRAELLNMLLEQDSVSRSCALGVLDALGHIGSKIDAAVLSCLSDEDEHVRRSALWYACRHLETNIRVADALHASFQHRQDDDKAPDFVLSWDSQTLFNRSPDLNRQTLLNWSPETLFVICKTYRDVVIPAVRLYLDHDDITLRWEAAVTLVALGVRDQDLVHALLSFLHDERWFDGLNRRRSRNSEFSFSNDLCWSASQALMIVGATGPSVVDVLERCLYLPRRQARNAAARVLAHLSSDDPKALDALIAGASSDDPAIRQSAIDWGLVHVQCAEPEVVALLQAQGLGNTRQIGKSLAPTQPSVDVAKEAAEDHEAASLLRQGAEAKTAMERRALIDNLGAMDTAWPDVVQVLKDLLSDEDEDAQWSAANALTKLGVSGSHVVAVLLDGMERCSRIERMAAYEGLVRAGDTSPRVVAALAWFVRHKWDTAVIDAVADLGLSDAAVVDALLVCRYASNGPDTCRLCDDALRNAAMRALGKVGAMSTRVVRQLIENEGSVALEALGRLGIKDQQVVSLLRCKMHDSDIVDQVAAATALLRIFGNDSAALATLQAARNVTVERAQLLAVRGLIELGNLDAPNIGILLMEIEDRCWSEYWSWGSWYKDAKELVQVLVVAGRKDRLLSTILLRYVHHPAKSFRFVVASTLMQLARDDEEIRATLENALVSDSIPEAHGGRGLLHRVLKRATGGVHPSLPFDAVY